MLAKSQKAMIWTGIVLSTLYGLGYGVLMGFFPPPSPMLGADEVLKLYSADNMQFRIGVAFMLVGGGFNMLWTVVFAVQMAREEKGTPIWSLLQFGAGTLSTALFFLPPIFWAVASFSIERAPELTLLMHELAFLTFITPVCMFPLQVVPIGIVALMKKPNEESLTALPRWIGYLTIWTAITAEAGVTALLFKSGPFAWNGLFPFYLPVVIFGIWLGAVFFKILGVVDRQQQA